MKMRNLISKSTIAIPIMTFALTMGGMTPLLADPRIDHSGSPYCEFPKNPLNDDPDANGGQYEDTCALSLDRASDSADGDIDSAIGVSVTPDQIGGSLMPYSIYGCPECPASAPCKVIDRKGSETVIEHWFLDVSVECVDGSCMVTRRLVCWHPF